VWNTDEQWLEHRMELYNKFLKPSIENQTEKNFAFVGLFDSRTPPKYLERFWYDYILIEKEQNTRDVVREKIPADGRLLTTRVDNDDCLNMYYVEAMQTVAQVMIWKDQKECLLIPSKGIDLHLKNSVCVGVDRPFVSEWVAYANPFISFLEYGTNKTVYEKKHWDMAQYPYKFVDNRHFRLRVMHDNNILNDSLLGLETTLLENHQGFSFLPSTHELMNWYNNRTKKG